MQGGEGVDRDNHTQPGRWVMTDEERAKRVEVIRSRHGPGCDDEASFLLSELDRVTKERDGYARQRDSAVEWSERHMADRDAALAQVAKLRDAVGWMRQTIHQAHGHEGAIVGCKRNTCSAAGTALRETEPKP